MISPPCDFYLRWNAACTYLYIHKYVQISIWSECEHHVGLNRSQNRGPIMQLSEEIEKRNGKKYERQTLLSRKRLASAVPTQIMTNCITLSQECTREGPLSLTSLIHSSPQLSTLPRGNKTRVCSWHDLLNLEVELVLASVTKKRK